MWNRRKIFIFFYNKIPWKNLLSESIIVNLKEININLSFNTSNYFTKDQITKKEELDINSFK